MIMDWGLSAAIVAVIAFICNCFTDAKVKRLTKRISEYEAKIEKPETEVGADDGASTS